MFEKIIFLDIDGVLNTPSWSVKAQTFRTMDPKAVNVLQQVVKAHDAQIVISSTWRRLKGWGKEIKAVMKKAGWDNPPIIGRTPPGISFCRGDEIAEWLEENPTKSFVIIDDVDTMQESQKAHFVHCDTFVGLTQDHVPEIEAIFQIRV